MNCENVEFEGELFCWRLLRLFGRQKCLECAGLLREMPLVAQKHLQHFVVQHALMQELFLVAFRL